MPITTLNVRRARSARAVRALARGPMLVGSHYGPWGGHHFRPIKRMSAVVSTAVALLMLPAAGAVGYGLCLLALLILPETRGKSLVAVA